MRTTIKLDDELLKEVKGIAARSGRSMNDVIEDAIRESLARRKPSHAAQRFETPVFQGDGVMPGVVSIPHGWGHDVDGIELSVASEHAGSNSNVLARSDLIDPLSGNAVLNGIPVEVTAADREPALA